MNTVLLLVLAYLLGSIPVGYWVIKYTKGIDLLTFGSGSTGTTNVLRAGGKRAAAIVFVLDVLKAYIPCAVCVYAIDHRMLPEIGNSRWFVCVIAIVCLIGHSKSIFLHFKGGKGAASALGATLAMNPIASLISFSLFVAIVYFTRYVSLASIIAVGTSAIVMWLISKEPSYTAFCALGGLYVVWCHRSNMTDCSPAPNRRFQKPVDQDSLDLG